MKEKMLITMSEEHIKIISLIAQLRETQNPSKRMKLFQNFKQVLLDHMTSEEKALYRYLNLKDGNKHYDHHEIKEGLQRLNLIKIGQDRWVETFKQFSHVVEDHCRLEDVDTFERMDHIFSNEEIEMMTCEFEKILQKNSISST